MKVVFSIYRYNSDENSAPYMKDYCLYIEKGHDMMLLDALIKIKESDPSLSFRRSCREGVCGSDGVNINGKNGLACVTALSKLYKNHRKIIIRPLPGFPVIRDLVVDMTKFYVQYAKVNPFLINDSCNHPTQEHLQSPKQRKKLEGLYECILCACCSSACPSFWWNPDKFVGPAGLLAAYRFLIDSRDTSKKTRLCNLNDIFSVFRCHNIMNCIDVCPKKLNPTKAISKIRCMLMKYDL